MKKKTAPKPKEAVNKEKTKKIENIPVEKGKRKFLDIVKEVFSNKKVYIPMIIIALVIGVGISYLIFSGKVEDIGSFIDVSHKEENKIEENPQNDFIEIYDLSYTFADYNLEETEFIPNLPDYSIAITELSNLGDFEDDQEVEFTSSQKGALTSSHFFITQNLDTFYGSDPEEESYRNDDWTQLYSTISKSGVSEEYREPENALFITTDFLLHVYHRLLENEFEYIEQTEFYPNLREMTNALYQRALLSYDESTDQDNIESYKRVIAFFVIPKVMLDSAYDPESQYEFTDKKLDTQENVLKGLDSIEDDLPEGVYDLAKTEIDRIYDNSEILLSSIFGMYKDYTQYGPRSHYNKNSTLRSYFRSMMWYGRTNFIVKSPELTRDAIHITQLMTQTGQAKNWESIYLPTTFFVGKSDDLGVYEYGEVISDLEIDLDIVNDAMVDQVQTEIADCESPLIMSSAIISEDILNSSKEEVQEETKGFRFMGQRFTPDAFISSTLTQGDEAADEETGEKLPSSTTALMIMSTLGNETAKPLVDEWIDENASSSTNVLNNRLTDLEEGFDSISQDTWTQNIYWGWLYTIKSLFTESTDKSGYPGFMKVDLWNRKNLQTSLGSWTELKHDTLLYAKQSYAEMGSVGEEQGEIPPVPKGYVEPNIPFFDRIIALTNMTMEGFSEMELLDNEFLWRNENLIESLEFFREIAVKEIQNETISDDDFERLRTISSKLDNILAPLPSQTQTENNARSALIADVHTDIIKQEILYEATGIPNYIYVAIKDKNGTRLTKGLVFSHYEFTDALTNRLTDENWREDNYTSDKSNLPSTANWIEVLMK